MSEWTSGPEKAAPARRASLGSALARAAAVAACVLLLAGGRAGAQATDTLPARGPTLGFINLDRLRLGALGVEIGVVRPSQVEPTTLFAVNADYGELFPGARLVFNVGYWGSRFTGPTVDRFRDVLRTTVIDPSGDDTLDLGRITLSDLALGADLRFQPRFWHALRPYVGGGGSFHVLNAEGKAISNTFVESALDNIGVGIDGNIGAELVAFGHVGLGAQLRYDLLSGARFGSARLTGTYHFDRTGRGT